MTDRKRIEARLIDLRGQLEKAEGTPTEVYSRIVGYYRSVRNWNAGKREEYGQRLSYGMPEMRAGAGARDAKGGPETVAPVAGATGATATVATASVELDPQAAALREGVLVFTRETCPNCPPVANYVVASGMKAVFVDVDRDEGLALARDLGVLATPTVLGLDEEGREAFRAFDLSGLKRNLECAEAFRRA